MTGPLRDTAAILRWNDGIRKARNAYYQATNPDPRRHGKPCKTGCGTRTERAGGICSRCDKEQR